jgi:hypothetical protein
MMRVKLIAIIAVFTISGCSAIKEKVGDMEKDALVQSISESVDQKLAARGLSISLLESAVDVSNTGKLNTTEVVTQAASMAKELALIETKKMVDDKIQSIQTSHMSKDDFAKEKESLWTRIVLGVLGLLSTYLGKQIVSGRTTAKTHANYHSRLKVLETLAGINDDDDADAESPSGDATAS